MLQREIGRNLEKVLAPFSLGIRAKKAELVLPPIFWKAWDFQTILPKSFSTICQQVCKNLVVKPSGPGALSGSMANRADLISSLVTFASKNWFFLAEIRVGTSFTKDEVCPWPSFSLYRLLKWRKATFFMLWISLWVLFSSLILEMELKFFRA